MASTIVSFMFKTFLSFLKKSHYLSINILLSDLFCDLHEQRDPLSNRFSIHRFTDYHNQPSSLDWTIYLNFKVSDDFMCFTVYNRFCSLHILHILSCLILYSSWAIVFLFWCLYLHILQLSKFYLSEPLYNCLLWHCIDRDSVSLFRCPPHSQVYVDQSAILLIWFLNCFYLHFEFLVVILSGFLFILPFIFVQTLAVLSRLILLCFLSLFESFLLWSLHANSPSSFDIHFYLFVPRKCNSNSWIKS